MDNIAHSNYIETITAMLTSMQKVRSINLENYNGDEDKLSILYPVLHGKKGQTILSLLSESVDSGEVNSIEFMNFMMILQEVFMCAVRIHMTSVTLGYIPRPPHDWDERTPPNG